MELARQNKVDVLSMPDNIKANIISRADSAKAPAVSAMIRTEIGAVNSSGEGVLG